MHAVERDNVCKCEKCTLPPPPKPHFKLSSELKEISILMELDMTNGFLLNDLVSE